MQSGLPIDIEKRHFLALGTTNITADLTEWNTDIRENRADILAEVMTTKQCSRPQMCCSESGLTRRRGVTCIPDLPSVYLRLSMPSLPVKLDVTVNSEQPYTRSLLWVYVISAA